MGEGSYVRVFLLLSVSVCPAACPFIVSARMHSQKKPRWTVWHGHTAVGVGLPTPETQRAKEAEREGESFSVCSYSFIITSIVDDAVLEVERTLILLQPGRDNDRVVFQHLPHGRAAKNIIQVEWTSVIRRTQARWRRVLKARGAQYVWRSSTEFRYSEVCAESHYAV